jgi:hypothetical protein
MLVLSILANAGKVKDGLGFYLATPNSTKVSAL